MGNHSLAPKTNRGMQTRNKLLRSAEYIFGKYGYHQSSITDITRHAGVSLGNFYTYFESKYQIFEALVWEMQRELINTLRERTALVDNRIDKEREGIKALFEFIKKRPYWYSLFPQAEFVDKELHKKIFEKFANLYIRRVEESIEKGEIRPINPEVIVYSLMGITNLLGMKWIIWENREVDDQMIDEVMEFVKRGIALEEGITR